jgi:hypothetical protein
MANLWVTGDSWGVLDKELPHTHWVNYYAKHYKLENIYCLARQSISQDMINYMTHCVVKNIPWQGREEKWSNYDDHLIVFPTTPTRITFKQYWDLDNFKESHGPHNLHWRSGGHSQVKDHPWYTETREDELSNLESENYTSLELSKNGNAEIVERFGAVHPEEFCDWRDTNHLNHIIKEVQTCKVYGRQQLRPYAEVVPKTYKYKTATREQVNHLNKERHLLYWQNIKEAL